MKNNANFKNNGHQNGKNFNKNSNKNSEFDFEEMAYEVSVLLEGMLYFAGVKRANLEKAAEIYMKICHLPIVQSISNDNLKEIAAAFKLNYRKGIID